METKLKEIKKHTSDLSEMKNQYLAERLLRSWKEDFTTSVLSGKKISCHSIVDYKFSKEYLENQS